MKFIYMIGVTNSGKSYFAKRAQELYPSDFGATDVGAIFRKRYPPGYFNGLGAMQSTENEAFEIFCEEVERVKAENKQFCLVNGQPRLISQIDRVVFPNSEFIWFHESQDVLKQRAETRDADPKAVQLSLDRLANDRISLYDVVHVLLTRKEKIHCLAAKHFDSAIHALKIFGSLFDERYDLYV